MSTDQPFTIVMACGHTDRLALDSMTTIANGHLCPTCDSRQHVRSFEVQAGWRPRLRQVLAFARAVLQARRRP